MKAVTINCPECDATLLTLNSEARIYCDRISYECPNCKVVGIMEYVFSWADKAEVKSGVTFTTPKT